MCEQKERGFSKDRAVEQDDGFGFLIGGVAEIEDVTVGSEATDDFGTWRGVHGQALGADGDFAVIADTDAGLLAPDVGPPGAGWGGTEDGTVFSQSQGASGVWGDAQFAMDFVVVGVEEELVEQVVGSFDLEDVIGGQERGQAFLPVVMAAFDFAFGLGCWGEAQGDAIEVQSGSELGESIRDLGEEEGVVIDIEGQGQTGGQEDTG